MKKKFPFFLLFIFSNWIDVWFNTWWLKVVFLLLVLYLYFSVKLKYFLPQPILISSSGYLFCWQFGLSRKPFRRGRTTTPKKPFGCPSMEAADLVSVLYLGFKNIASWDI
jgi:hypothetical protein